MTAMKVVYIACPYTGGDVAANVARCMEVAHLLMDAGYCPIAPLLSHFLHVHRQRPYEDWMAIDMELLRRSDAVIRLSGESPGADRETAAAALFGIPVVRTIPELTTCVTVGK